MLLITPHRNSASVTRYFTQKKSYHEYLSENDTGIGTWGGRGATRLGLAGSIHPEHFAALCDNAHPLTGEKLTARLREKRRIGYDLTFDMPKSVSVVYGVTEDARILKAFWAAVTATMQELESQGRWHRSQTLVQSVPSKSGSADFDALDHAASPHIEVRRGLRWPSFVL